MESGRGGETGREACPNIPRELRNRREAQVGQQKQTYKALIHNNIKAFIFVPTETILKHLYDLIYLVYMFEIPEIGLNDGFWGWGNRKM
jgi:hypothetical protein